MRRITTLMGRASRAAKAGRISGLRRWAALGVAAVLLVSTALPAWAEEHRWAPAMEIEDGDHLAKPAVAPASEGPAESPDGATEKSSDGVTEKSPDGATEESSEGATEESSGGATEESSEGATEEEARAAAPKPAVDKADPVKITAPSAILMESRSGRVLYQKNAHDRRNPASVTKIMTLIIAFDALRDGKVKLDDKVTISDEAAKQIGTIIFADTGETFSLEELLLSVAVGSANDAAVAVAEHVAGSEEAFVQLMNAKAKELGMNDTQFINPTGLSADGHMTSAYDIALMSRYAANNYPELMKLTAIYGADLKVPWRKNGPTFRLWNNNKLLTWYTGSDGLKTGWTELAGYCLAATAVKNDVRMISVIMGADSPKVRNAEAARLLDYGFANYTSVELAGAGKKFGPVQVARGKISTVQPVPRSPFGVSVAKGEQSKVKTEVRLPRRLEAPLTKGQTVGEIIATLEGKEIGKMELVSPVDVAKANLWETILQQVKGVFTLR